MWPSPDEAVVGTTAAENALGDLYAEALRRWEPALSMQVLPTLENFAVGGARSLVASSLPPDPDGVDRVQFEWDDLAGKLIAGGMSAIWAVHFVDGVKALGGKSAGGVAGEVAELDPAVLSIVKKALGVDVGEISAARGLVAGREDVAAKLEGFAAQQAENAASVPGRVKDKIAAAIGGAGDDAGTAMLRGTVRTVIAASSPEMRDLAREKGYQAAGVMNDAALAAADDTGDEELEKTWLATLDGATRATHWAADGQRVPKDGEFTVGGESLRYPGDPSGSAAEIANCRCRVGVLGKDEALPDESDKHTERLDGRDSVAVRRQGRSQQEEIDKRAAEGNIRARDDEDGQGHVAGSAAMEVTTDQEDTVADDISATYRTFTDATIALVGEPTSDGRMLAAGIDLSFRPFPLPLMWTKQNSGGHMDAFTVGAVESARVDGGKVLASGYLLNTAEADWAAEQIAHGVTGPSVDLAATEWMLTDDAGNELTEAQWLDLPMDAKVFQTVTVAELIGTTLVSTPAFGATELRLNAEREPRDVGLVASAAEDFQPRTYDHRLFEDPKLSGPTLPTMGDDGRVYGHLACFGECHRSIQSQCVLAPRSASGYRHFHTSPALRLDDGRRLPVGRLTVGTGHAPDRLRPGPAAAHYDDTGTCFALVRVGEDEHGIWFSGVPAPGASAEQIEMGLSAPLSGDWRDFGEGLELIAALAVNTPGFAARGRDDDQGRPIALVASLGPPPDSAVRDGVPLTVEAIKAAVSEGVAEARDRERFTEERESVLTRADALAGPMPSPNDEVAELLAGAR